MRRRLQFEKDLIDWFVVLPEWEGDRADLQMVCGADTWLDLLCDGEWHIWLVVSDEPFDGAEEIIVTHGEDFGSGQWYETKTYMGLEYNIKMWLCDVTKFVFGYFPSTIYYKKS